MSETLHVPFSPKYTPEQRAAIVGAVLDNHRTVPATVKLAALGELGEPFTVSEGAAYSMVAKERAWRWEQEGVGDPYAIAADIGRRLLKLADREIGRFEGLPERSAADVRAMREWAKTASMAVDLAALPPADGVGDDAPASAATAGRPPRGLAARIAATIESGADTVATNGHSTTRP